MRGSSIVTRVLLLFVSSSTIAAPKGNGVSGELSVMAGIISSQSNFDTDNAEKKGDLNTVGESNQDFLALPLGQLRYNFGSNTQHELFLGTSRADIIQGVAAIEIGYKHWFGRRSFVAISALPTIMKRETWSDPFLTDEVREVTDESGNAYRFQYEDILGTGLNADVGYYEKTIDSELSGSDYSESTSTQLKREGEGFYSKLSWTVYAGPGMFLQPSVRRNSYSAEGQAQSSTLWGYSLTLIRRSQQHFLAITGDYSDRGYDASHPLFGQVREDKRVGATGIYQYNDLLGYRHLSANFLLTYSDVDSNLDFYDENTLFVATGLTYKF